VTRPYTKLRLKILSEYLHLDDNGDWYWLQHRAGRGRARKLVQDALMDNM
jgi:hypothetical protein